MTDVADDELIASAAAVVNPQLLADRSAGTVACTLVTVAGNRYSGVCIDASLAWASVRSTPPSRPW